MYRDIPIIYDNMEHTLDHTLDHTFDHTLEKLFESYDYYKNVKNQYVKSGRELEYYSYHPHTNKVVVPLINQEATYVAKIPDDKVVNFLIMHLENNEKYLLDF